ncbi:MAG: S-layer homology domain-containing protein [Candidatus Gracilibacteria bacterium]|nr:S-layer homology domain-containing protein [Candidatus Gracilibacteria bacterium]
MYPLKTKTPYNPDNLAATANIFTTMYLGNYVFGDYDEGSGSHPGVDIVPQIKHDNVFACLSGIVYFAGTSASNGNYIVLKHDGVLDPSDFNSTTTLYSSHLHLAELCVKTGDRISEGDIIGKSGNTGNSTGEHLHFQIDTATAPFHPYWPFTFKEAADAGLGFFDAVNKGLGIENARKYTINPLVYLDKVSSHKGTSNAPTINLAPISVPKTVPKPVISNKSKYFNDIKDNIEEIDYLYNAGVTKGYSDGTFRPESNITRSEILIMAYKFKKLEPTGNGVNFPDVLASDFAYPYISSASSRGYIKGYSDGNFCPNNPVTRAEAIAIILNIVIGKEKFSTTTTSNFQDVSSTDWYCRYTNFVSVNGLLDTIGKFYPNDNMKRKDLAVMLYNLRDRV